jgi:hypothetical protein
MIIFVPRGDPSDPTRPPAYYDETVAFLKACGLKELTRIEADAPYALSEPTRVSATL